MSAADERARIAASLARDGRVLCPIHDMPDCSPLLNACSRPKYLADGAAEAFEILAAELGPSDEATRVLLEGRAVLYRYGPQGAPQRRLSSVEETSNG